MTGAKFLWVLLTQMHVVKTITLGNDYLEFKCYPAFLNELPAIEELIINKYAYGGYSNWVPTVSNMPMTLRKLKIEFDPPGFFSALASCPTKDIPPLETLEIDCVWGLPVACELFSRTLTRLHCRSWDGSVPLPLNLLHLRCRLSIGSYPITFPASLETLTLIDNKPALPPLPASLISLYSINPRHYVSIEQVDHLPKSITELGKVSFDEKALRAASQSVIPFPCHLIKLIAAFMPVESWAHLPKTLQILILSGVPSDPLNIPLQQLPKSITELEMHFSSSTVLDYFGETSSTHFFPPGLTRLGLQNVLLTANATKKLPSTLKDLEISYLYDQVVEHLPRALTKLRGGFGIQHPKLLKDLPDSITDLQILNSEIFAGANLSSADDFTADGYELLLPSKLQRLSLGFTGVSGLFTRQTFRWLEHLDLRHDRSIDDRCIQLFPRRLTYLNLAYTSKVTGKVFKELPRTLIWLNLESAEEIFDEDIVDLPKALDALYIDSAIHLTNSCLRLMPRSLGILRIDMNKIIDSSAFADLPYKLWSSNPLNSFSTGTWTLFLGEISLV